MTLLKAASLPRPTRRPAVRLPVAWLGLAATVAFSSGCHQVRAGRPGAAAGETCGSGAVTGGAAGAGAPAVDPVATFDSAWSIVARTHWDTTYNGVNWKAVRDSLRPKALRARTTGELRDVLGTMVGTLRQSHFSIIPGEMSDAGESGKAGASMPADHGAGIGATIRDVDGALVLSQIRQGGPADRAGLRPGFIIEAVDGCPVAPKLARIPATLDARRRKLNAWSLGSAMLAGTAGDTVRVRGHDGRGRTTVAIARETEPGYTTKFGNLPPMAAALTYERRAVDGRSIGVIHFNIWMPVLTEPLKVAIDALRDVDAIVLDVRGNLGGIGVMSAGVAGYFIDSAVTLGTMLQRGSNTKFIVNPHRLDGQNRRVQPFSGPLAVVVDELSASTTEIFAGGLQALRRARVFGAQTAGQALPSIAERLPNGDVLYHAIANFLSPTGKPVEGAGVTPDVATPLTRKLLLRGADPALDAALSWAATAAKKGAALQ